jgi:iron complex outermembrane receptor protein
MGRRFGNGVELALSGTYAKSHGVDRLYFPAYDTPATNNGIAEGLDGERVGQLYGQLRVRSLTFTGLYGRRQKDVPTASFGAVFNEQSAREQTTDRHVLADLEYNRSVGAGRLTLRGTFDRFSSAGAHPFGEDDGSVLVVADQVLGSRWSAGARFTRPIPGRQVLTVGSEVIDNLHQDQAARNLDPPAELFVADRSSTQQAAYVQDEIKLTTWLIANGGLRYDRYEDFSRLTPRAALIVMPSSDQSFKYLYGRAFRAPNAFEQNTFYFGENSVGLHPESIDTHELVWERYANDWLRTSVSTYWYKADGLITLTLDPSAFLGTTYVNEGHVRAKGLELEAQMRLSHGFQSVMSYALQRAENHETGSGLVNSPAHMAKLRLSVTGPSTGSSLSMDLQSMSSRRTLSGATLGPATTVGMTMIVPLGRTFEVIGSARNLFNVQYADPASDSHLQDDIPQNGRTLRIGLRWKLWAKR